MNAIDRLRRACQINIAPCGVPNCPYCERKQPTREALAAVDALYQAAKELDGYANDESGPYVLVRLDELREVAAAVRRVEGE